VVVPKLNSYFMATVIAGMEEITNQQGYGLIISQSQESGKKETGCVSTLFHSRVDGLLVSLAYDTENIDHFNQILRKNIPVVFFDRVSNCPGCMGIVIDNFRAGYEVTSHLISQGCRRILHLSGNLLRNVYSGRFEGYRQALADNGIPFEDELLMVSELGSQAGIEVARAVMRMKDPPDGIFTANDTSAVAAICELQKSGMRIPEDIAVAGFNNEPVSRVIKPCLTTVDYPASEIGRLAANSLINILHNKGASSLSTIIVKHELIIRESTLRKKRHGTGKK
jgi:LacI family transcriptional regulator